MTRTKIAAHTVEKIGGTSMAEPEAVLANVLLPGDRADPFGRIFVVSAYAGVTNALLEDKRTGEPGAFVHFATAAEDGEWRGALERATALMLGLNRKVFGTGAERSIADEFVRERIAGAQRSLEALLELTRCGHFRLRDHLATAREMLSSIGEAHSAHNTVLLVRKAGVAARFVDLTGWNETSDPTLDKRIRRGFADVDLARELPIATGYARTRGGLLKRYGRGYSEVTLSRVSVLTRAREAVIHKEYHLSSADPRLVGPAAVRAVGRTNYDVADQLANLGMEAIHPNAAAGLRRADIPLRVRNTFEPGDAGTLICSEYAAEDPAVEIVTGREDVHAIEVFAQDMLDAAGWDARIVQTLESHGLAIVGKDGNANTITHYVSGADRTIDAAVGKLKSTMPNASVSVHRVAIVSAIGSNLGASGFLLEGLGALESARVRLLAVQQAIRQVELRFIVKPQDYRVSVRALHERLVGQTAESGSGNGRASPARAAA
jgi:aspartate kinase